MRRTRAHAAATAAAGGSLLVLAANAMATPPPPPQGLRAPAITAVAPHLEWEASDGATSYRIRRVDGGCSGTFFYVGTKRTTFFNDGPVESIQPALPGHTYGYVVRAVTDPIESSGDSNCVTVTYDADPPVIDSFAAAPQPTGSVLLSYAAADPSGPVTFAVRRSAPGQPPPSGPADGVAACDAPPGSTSCLDAGTVSGARYGYRLFAVDAVGNVSSRVLSGVLALDTLAPSSPAGLAALPGSGSVTVSWTAVPAVGTDADVAGYRVVYKPGSVPPANAGDGAALCDVGLGTTTCMLTGQPNGQALAFAVFARDEVPNWSPAGPTAVATPVAGVPAATPPPVLPVPSTADHDPPGSPTRLAVHVAATGVTVTWRNPAASDLDHVVLVRNAKHRPRTPSDGTRLNVGKRTHALLAAERGNRFHVALFAYDRAGNASQATAADVVVPVVLPVAGSLFATGPLLSWKAVPKAAYYNVVVTRSGKRVATGWPLGLSWRAPRNLKPGLYRWYVWPGFGPKDSARYGHLIGTASFRVKTAS
jgi:hypothetical protein